MSVSIGSHPNGANSDRTNAVIVTLNDFTLSDINAGSEEDVNRCNVIIGATITNGLNDTDYAALGPGPGEIHLQVRTNNRQ